MCLHLDQLVFGLKTSLFFAGVIINTCGWVRGEGYNQLKHIAQAFEVSQHSKIMYSQRPNTVEC